MFETTFSLGLPLPFYFIFISYERMFITAFPPFFFCNSKFSYIVGAGNHKLRVRSIHRIPE